MPHVSYQLIGPVAVLHFTNPPVNGLSHAVRRELSEALARALADDGVAGIVLTGGPTLFSGGADIREFGTPASQAEPNLRQLIEQVENSTRPVVAAIGGLCLGGGLELALAAHYRVASSTAKLGLPEVKLGLIPGAGGTQRLPRLLGVERALALITGGEPVPAATLAGSALLDGLVDGDPIPVAVELAGSGHAPRRSRDLPLDAGVLATHCAATRTRLAGARPALPAPRRAVDAVEAGARSFDDGLAMERALFLELMQSPESAGLRHAFFAERQAGKIPDVPESVAPRPLERAAVIGAGTMGSGIAICFLNAGIPVTLLETDQPALDRGIARIGAVYEAQLKKGKLSGEERDRRMALLTPTLAYDVLWPADIAIEAVFESWDAKQAVFQSLDRALRPGAILASNTSTLDLNRLAALTARPRDVIGTHFFSPANVMRLLELVRGTATAPDVLATALRLGKLLRKVTVVSGVSDGFIGNRMLEQYTKQAAYLLEEGATPAQVDQAIEQFGIAMGPFRVADLVGNDVSWAIRQRRRAERPGYRYSTLPDRLCELGRFGQKTQGGWYDYPEGPRTAVAAPVVEQLIMSHRDEIGLTPRNIPDEEIVDRLILALVNEGARILEEGIALRASDIDVVYLTGYGFPAFRGGPMFHADRVGLAEVRRRIERFGRNPHGDPAFWTPAPLLARLAREEGSFNR